jgi:adenosylhomocysteine nucleosidase
VDAPVIAKTFSAKGKALTLVCALKVEERAARRGGARTALGGLGAGLPLPDGRLVSFGFAGGLEPGFRPGTLVTATRVVDSEGRTLWDGPALEVEGAERAVVCASDSVANEPEARRDLARRSGASVVDMESGVLASTGRLAGVVRAVSDSGDQPVGRLVCAGKADGGTDWKVVATAFVTEPVKSFQTARDASKATAALRRAASALAEGGRP